MTFIAGFLIGLSLGIMGMGLFFMLCIYLVVQEEINRDK